MNQHTETILEINQIKEQLMEFAYTENAKEQIRNLKPYLSEGDLKRALMDTTEAKEILEKIGTPPMTSFDHVEEYLEIAEKGGCLTEEQLEEMAMVLSSVKRLKEYLNRAKELPLNLPYYEEQLDAMEEINDEIRQKIRNGRVDDYATRNLKNVREELERLEQKMRLKAETILKSNKECMSDSFVTKRNGRLCLPVKKEYKYKIPGTVVDSSSSGSTLFIEPATIGKYTQDYENLQLEEENEVRMILYTLSAMLADANEIFAVNQRIVEKLDFWFAKGRLSQEYDAAEPELVTERRIEIQNGRHPLMEKDKVVPLQFSIGNGNRGMIITGPNTGGKTVAIKTVGITCYMAQCGLHVSCEKASVCMHNQILCDIGDGQNISENLSTFSSHIKNVLQILTEVTGESLVIMDELGSGTDPTEGMGIAIAVLEELKKSGALFLVTSHYPEVKNYAKDAEQIMNARMAFDRESLKPLYKLEMGQSGESCALYIAQKLGMPTEMLKRASLAAYGVVDERLADAQEEHMQGQPDMQKQRKSAAPKLQKEKKQVKVSHAGKEYQLGDSVMVLPDKKIGIVCERANEKGVLRVQLPDKKIWISHKRVKLQVAAGELYPEDYDFSIIFDSVEVRKARHDMSRKYCENTEVQLEGKE